MNSVSNSPRDNAGSLLSWLGFGNILAKDRGDATYPGNGNGSPIREAALEKRSWLLESISSFLLDHDLDVSPSNLLAAHSAFSGMNPRLARQIASRIESGEKITQEWLNEVGGSESSKKNDQDIAELMARLEAQLDTFSKSTNAARNAATSYNSELEQHVAELEEIEEAGQILTSLVGLAKAMLDRTRKVECEMRKSEEEAVELRANLEIARHDAEIDHLTGLPNRRAFEAHLEQQYLEADAAIEPLSVAFCDIDNFKRINDTHGHEAGDRVIKVIADTLAKIANNSCFIARHGGEEFVLLFRNMSIADAKARLDEVREQLAERRLINRKNDVPFGQITFSGGVADVFAFQDPGAALRAADEALYIAKENGRNRIVLAGS
ncbi:MAG: GGDEF domain-containing protein [Novosphingobium sp.]